MRKHLQRADEHCNAQDRRLAALQREVKALQQDVRQAREDRDPQQQSKEKRKAQELLGEAAYKLCALVEEHVFQGRDPSTLMTPSLKQICKRRGHGVLLLSQAERWEQLLQLAPAGLTEDLVQSDAILRCQKQESAHGSWEQLQNVNIQHLRQWADAYVDNHALQPVHLYLELLNRFSTKNTPLCLDKSIQSVCQARGVASCQQSEASPPILQVSTSV